MDTYLTAPPQRWRFMRKVLPKRLQPFARGLRKRIECYGRSDLAEPYRSVFPFTQASPARQQNLVLLGRQIDAEDIPGAIIECGVLDGGTAALMGYATASRPLHLFDAWQGLPETTEEDGEDSVKWAGQVVGSPKRVMSAMAVLRVDQSRVNLHRGWFSDTFPGVEIAPVALVHVDCDFYDPTKLCLEKWFPALSEGGFMQFDDYSEFVGCKRAVDEFLAEHPELTLEKAGTGGAAYYFRKPLKRAGE